MRAAAIVVVALAALCAAATASSFAPAPTPTVGLHLKYHMERSARDQRHAAAGRQALRKTVTAADAADVAAPNPYPYGQPSHYSQTVDHFDASNTARFWQRFWYNETCFRGAGTGAPVFLFIEGESNSVGAWVAQGHTAEMGCRAGALLVTLEHRMYGLSAPAPDMSLANMPLLSSRQALADLAEFTGYVQTRWSLAAGSGEGGNPFFSFGGSYAGALSSFYRLKHSDVVYGAVASSPPVQAVLNFENYDNSIAESYNTTAVGGSAACVDAMNTAFEDLTARLQTAASWPEVQATFHLCAALGSANDTVVVASTMADTMKGVAQYNVHGLYGYQIRSVCAVMTDASVGTPYARLAKVFSTINTGVDGSCLDGSYQHMVAYLANTTVDVAQASRQWTWQTCNEFGYFQDCNTDEQCMFSSLETLQYYTDLCQTLFGVDAAATRARIDATNAYYGALEPASTRVVFVNGLIDPWHKLSILTGTSADTTDEPAVVIATGSHCADMYAYRATDGADLLAGRAQIETVLTRWIAESGAGPAPPTHDDDHMSRNEKIVIGCTVGGGLVLFVAIVLCCCRTKQAGHAHTNDHFARIADQH